MNSWAGLRRSPESVLGFVSGFERNIESRFCKLTYNASCRMLLTAVITATVECFRTSILRAAVMPRVYFKRLLTKQR